MKRNLAIVGTIAVVVVLAIFFLIFFRASSIIVRHEGKPIAAKVYVNEEYKGESPLNFRWPNEFRSISFSVPSAQEEYNISNRYPPVFTFTPNFFGGYVVEAELGPMKRKEYGLFLHTKEDGFFQFFIDDLQEVAITCVSENPEEISLFADVSWDEPIELCIKREGGFYIPVSGPGVYLVATLDFSEKAYDVEQDAWKYDMKTKFVELTPDQKEARVDIGGFGE